MPSDKVEALLKLILLRAENIPLESTIVRPLRSIVNGEGTSGPSSGLASGRCCAERSYEFPSSGCQAEKLRI